MQTTDGAQRLLPSTYCPFCTEKLSVIQTRDLDATDAFSLGNLLPCGTITVSVHDGGSPCPGASHSRDWHSLPIRNLSTHPADALFRQLAFLAEHLFLRATCKLGPSGRHVFVRIYLVPNDLPNVCGKLHHRPEAVVKEAQRHMHDVVPLIEQNSGLWDADETCLGVSQSHFLSSQIDNRTMAEIYGELPSPDPSSLVNEKKRLSYRIASGDAIWGLRTSLYGYQRRSVATMLHKESTTSPIPDPTYIAVSCMSGDRCYIQPSTMTVFRGCPLFSPPRAGILCEELGTGKTIMIIALILATATQHADPEQSPVDERLAMTPLAYAHFPSREYALARDRAGLGQQAIPQVPSLVEVLLDYFSMPKAASARLRFADELEASHLWPLILANKPFYHHFDTDLAAQFLRRSSRHLVPNLVSPRTMFLSSATLVIVPLTLLGQWKNEIDKHCHDNVRYLIVRPSMVLPGAKKLASDYELIVMSDTRFRKESKKDKTAKLYALKPCACPSLEGSRVPDCRCPGDPDVTPLFQVRWKRLVIDEGHTVGNMATSINHFVRKLSIQHKWIVTGTPTSNLLGLQLGHTTDEQESDQYANPEVESEELLYPDSDCSQDGGPCHVRVWGNYDSLNLRKLGTMIADFIAIPRFRADLKSFMFHVSTPLCDPHGPRPGSINVLSQVMQTVMVRHRVEDVESDVLLPPIEHNIIYLDLGNYARLSYNALQAGLAINAIDSMREGRDYMFHPSQAKELQKAINKSSQGLFWSCADDFHNVDEICRLAEDYCGRAIKRIQKPERKISPQDLDLLRQALEHAAVAANDQVWRSTQPYLGDVPFKVSGLDPAVFEAWNRTKLRDVSQMTHFMHADRLVHLRSLVRKNPLISRDDLVEEGNITERNENERSVSKSSHKANLKHANQTKKMVKEVQETIEVMRKHVERMNISEDEEREEYQVTSSEAAAVRVTGSPHLSGVTVGPSLSTKLNYILSEVQQFSAKEKILIFSNSLMTLTQIYEALSLFEVKCLRYTNEVDYLLREQCITSFETSDVYRVLLMDLKLGARGLNLISASRVIFCEPVWHPDVESQAIKRVHRIGQTRPVTVKTLVIRSTAEEAMISRRQYLRGLGSGKVPTNMMAESGMRQYLQYPSFLSESTSSDSDSLILSLDDNRVTSINAESAWSAEEGGASHIDVESGIPTAGESEDRAGDAMARKRVRFE